MKYFVYDFNGNGFDTFNTKKEAKKYAQECLDFDKENDNLNFLHICWGEIKEAVHANDEILELKKVKQLEQ